MPSEANIDEASFPHGLEHRELWVAHVCHQCSSAREQLIEHYTNYARHVTAKLYANRQVAEVEFADYFQLALEGLLEAVDRFNPARTVRFETFAAARISGAVLNGIAKSTDRQEQISLRARVNKERRVSLAGAGEGATLFEKLAQMAVGLVVGYMLEDSGMYQDAEEAVAPASAYERMELKQLCEVVRRLVELLPDRQRRVIKYHYFHGHTFDRISETLGLTPGRISQIHAEALRQLGELHRQYGALNKRL